MADDQHSSNDVGENGDEHEISDYDETTTATIVNPVIADDYDDEPIEDYVVKLVVNEQPDGPLSPDLIDAAVTDIHGNIISSNTKISDSITTAIYDELSGNGTAIAGGKRWWGDWSTKKLIVTGLIALCIIGIILVIVFLVLGKKFKKNKRSTPAGAATTTTKAAGSQDPKYQPVPNV